MKPFNVMLCLLLTIITFGIAYLLIAAAWYGSRTPFAVGWTVVLSAVAFLCAAAIWEPNVKK